MVWSSELSHGHGVSRGPADGTTMTMLASWLLFAWGKSWEEEPKDRREPQQAPSATEALQSQRALQSGIEDP